MSRNAQLRIFDAGSTSSVDLTLGISDLGAYPIAGTPAAYPLDGRTESRPWSVRVVDVGSTFSHNLGDSTGRLDLLHRVADFQIDDGSGFATIHTGRIVDIILTPNIGEYDISIGDERVLERNSRIFTSSTTMQCYPASIHGRWNGFSTAPNIGGRVFAITGKATLVGLFNRKPGALPAGVKAAIRDDLIANPVADSASTSGNFNNLRLNYGGVDYEVKSFDVGFGYEFTRTFLDSFDREVGQDETVQCWVATTAIASTAGTDISGVFLHMHGAEPSPGLPLHLYSSSGDWGVGTHPFRLLRRIYAGEFGGQVIRVSTSAFDTLEGEQPYLGYGFWRITEPANMAQWVEENIYKPFGALPFIDAQGRVAPRTVLLQDSFNVDPDTIGEFTSTNLTEHPTWAHDGYQRVTVIRFDYDQINQIALSRVAAGYPVDNGDRAEIRTFTREVTNDNSSQVGRFEHNIRYRGFHGPWNDTRTVLGIQEFMSQEIFDRWGDGPIVGGFGTLYSAGSTTIPGDAVKLTLPSYPNPASTTGRGDTRLVQILERNDEPSQCAFTYLDYGPNVAALEGPGFSVARSTVNPFHEVTVTVSSLPTTSATWIGQYAVTATSATPAPSSDSDEWLPIAHALNVRDTTGSVTLSRLPSGRLVYVTLQSQARNRIRSPRLFSVQSTTTQTLATPSSVGQVSEFASKVVPTWVVGTTQYPMEFYLDRSTSGTFDSSNYRMTIPAGNSPPTSSGHGVAFGGLSTATNSTDNAVLLGARHVDSYGGVGDYYTTTATLSTTAALEQLPGLLGLNIVGGQSIQ